MSAIIGALLFIIIAIMTILVALGAPIGEFTMGGQHKVLPKQFRIMAIFSLLIQILGIVIILQAGGFIELWFSKIITKYLCTIFAIYLSFNTIMNLSSKSKKEKMIMTPLALIAAICFWINAINM